MFWLSFTSRILNILISLQKSKLTYSLLINNQNYNLFTMWLILSVLNRSLESFLVVYIATGTKRGIRLALSSLLKTVLVSAKVAHQMLNLWHTESVLPVLKYCRNNFQKQTKLLEAYNQLSFIPACQTLKHFHPWQQVSSFFCSLENLLGQWKSHKVSRDNMWPFFFGGANLALPQGQNFRIIFPL